MKFLAVTPYYKPAYGYGGPVSSESALYEGLAKLGVEVTVITTNANGSTKLNVPLLTPTEVDGVKVIYCPTKPAPGSPFYSPAQIELTKRLVPCSDIVNLQNIWGYETDPLRRICNQNQIPYFVTLHGQMMDYALKRIPWRKRIKKQIFLRLVGYRFLNGAAALHCTSQLEIDHLRQYPVSAPVFLVPNGITGIHSKSLPNRGQLREKLGIPGEAFVLALIGRIHEKKNPQIAVASMIAAKDLQTPVHLIIAGPDEQNLKPSLQRQAELAGCGDRLHFTGLLMKDELQQALVDSDLLLMPSEAGSENFGMSAAEGMAAGLPVLVSEQVPVGEWAKQGGAGELASCEVNSFSEATRKLLMQPALLRTMGENGKRIVGELFDNDIVVKKMLYHVEQIVSDSRHGKAF